MPWSHGLNLRKIDIHLGFLYNTLILEQCLNGDMNYTIMGLGNVNGAEGGDLNMHGESGSIA